MRYFYLVFLFSFLLIESYAQDCNTCTVVYENYTGNIDVKNNAKVCLKGTYSGNIQMSGGILNICGRATISSLTYTQPSSVCYVAEGARVRIQSIGGSTDINIQNRCDSLVIDGGNFNYLFSLKNYRKAYLQGGNFNGRLSLVNTDTLIVNTSMNLGQSATFVNSKYFLVNGNISPNNATMTFQNQCQFRVNGDMNLNGQTVTISGGYFRINNVNINSGKIVLSESSVCYVNQLTVGGLVEGTGSRSSLVCTYSPNLNRAPSIKGNISVCVKNGTFTPNPGTIEAPATIDCNNPIPGSDCNPEPFGYAYFRMVPQQSSSWNNSATWEIFNGTSWAAAPAGRYPTKGCAVLIGDGKEMTVSNQVEISKLVLGQTTGVKLIMDSSKLVTFKVSDTISLASQSKIEINSSTVLLEGLVTGEIKVKGNPNGNLRLRLEKNPSIVLRMDQTGTSNVLNVLSYQLGTGAMLTLADTLHIAGALEPLGGTLLTNDKLILNSDANRTATIAPGVGNYIQGKITVNRYVPAVARRFRFVSTPVSDANLLDIQGELFVTGNNAAGTATGTTVGQLNSAGFDATETNVPSAYWYNETATGSLNNGWIPVSNETGTLADYPLLAGRGYRLFIRGDRSDLGRLDGTVMDQNEVTINVKGTPNMGNISVPVFFSNVGPTLWDNGWNQIGNPYASNIDWKAVFKDSALSANIEPTVWTYDEVKNTYVSYNALTGAGTLNGGLIANCQSFWVKANGPANPLVFKEKYKTVSASFHLQRLEDNRDDEVKITLIKDSINQDQAILKYKPGSLLEKDKYDILKFWGGSVGVSFYNPEDTTYLDLSVRPVNYIDADKVQLYFYVDSSGEYTFRFERGHAGVFRGNSKLYLFDAFTNEYINIADNFEYTFSVDMINDATQDMRFSFVFFPTSSSLADVNYFFGTPSDTASVLLEWGSLMEPIPTTYYIERGLSTSDFAILGTQQGTGSEERASDYEFLDTTVAGYTELYYRIGYNDSVNRAIEHTPIIRINLLTGEKEVVKAQSDVQAYPNPVGNMLTVQSAGFVSESSRITVLDITGKQWISLQIVPQGQDKVMIDLAQLPQGMYLLQIKSAGGILSQRKILKN